MNTLVIVESPNKEKTIKKFLGDNYEVMSSVGHIVELTTKGPGGLGIDLETWEPIYKIEKTKKDIVKNLKKQAEKSDLVLIATDPDREGEAIGQNLVEYLDIKNKYKRIKYNEITKEAILRAIDNPLMIDEDLVNAQKSRRMLDRIVGFGLSKLIASKVKNSPAKASAGRVQSIALKLVIDREKEISAFIPFKYDNIVAKLKNGLECQYYNPETKDMDSTWILPKNSENILKSLKGDLTVTDIKKTKKTEAKATPFKQSVLYKRSGLAASTVQSALQSLYEGFGDGGLISYPRTDSTRLSPVFIKASQDYIAKKYGENYVSKSIKGIAGDQDAHEAIRPTYIELTPQEAIAKYNLSSVQGKIYTLIYNNTIQAIMEPPVKEIIRYQLENNGNLFKISNSNIIFDGYYAAVAREEKEINIPVLSAGEKLEVSKYELSSHRTKPPARYNDGSLIEALDEIKVGRPSTFAQTVKIIKERKYVDLEGKAFVPTKFGTLVLEMLIKNFPKIINENYTAKLEEELDEIANGQLNYKNSMSTFKTFFDENVKDSYQKIETQSLEIEYVNEICPESGDQLIYRYNKKNGQRFIACQGFPKCRFLKPDPDAKPIFKKQFTKKAK